MSVLVYVEHAGGFVDEASLQALVLARGLGGSVEALAAGSGAESLAGQLGEHGAAIVHVPADDALSSYAPAALGQCLAELAARLQVAAIVGPGTERGNEVLAYLAAKADLPMAANVIAARPGDPLAVTRVRWGGSLLEDAHVHGSRVVVSVQPHALSAEPTGGAPAAVEPFTPSLSDADLAVRVVGRRGESAGGVSLADAKVVVSAGRGAGSAEGFAGVEDLAALLGGAVGCSRAVTMAGWRPHTDQVGQTGTKIAPDLYIACGISGATQHMAGCKGAKKLLAVNNDPEAPILGSADYAVIGDLHDVVPAISAEIRRRRGG